MLASRRPSTGEILSILGPPPRHVPQKTPSFSSAIPSLSSTDCIVTGQKERRLAKFPSLPARYLPAFSFLHPSALFTHQLHRFVDNFRRHVQGRTKPDCLFAGTQCE